MIPTHATFDLFSKKIVLGSDKTADYQITVKGDIATGSKVNVAPHDDVTDVDGVNFKMNVLAGKAGDPVNANVTQAITEWNYADVIANSGNGTAKPGSIDAPDLTKGSWSGNLTFDISFADEYAN